MKKIFFIMTCLFFSLNIFSEISRKPAVENFLEVSISPTGFNFDSPAIQPSIVQRIKSYIPPYVAFSFLLLPLCFWFASFISFRQDKTTQLSTPDNVEFLDKYRNQSKSASKEKMDHIKKVG